MENKLQWNIYKYAYECNRSLSFITFEKVLHERSNYWNADTVTNNGEPALQRHWRKAAEPVYRDGRLIPYEDRDLDEATRKKIKQALDEGEDSVQVSWRFAIEESRALSIQQNGV